MRDYTKGPVQHLKHINSYTGLPELLSPAGSPEALCAAIEGGADAVYFGGGLFSNRMRAKNFDEDELARAVAMCKAYSVKSYITVNTRLRDAELPEALALVRKLYLLGADAFIVADTGLAAAVKELLPDAELHASTQMTGINGLDAETLAELGFSRMVCPRELSSREIAELVKASPIEIEMFVHGAHCVSVSGQCLMSWAMGGRSGNRGECAQPCRLPYRMGGCKNVSSHPLSLKDMCLARHVPEIIDLGVSSLKIEGRLKSPDYVYGVTKIYRQLLDERRGATDEEIARLDEIFSRDGFTDGYFKKSYSGMVGMRRENAVSSGEKFERLTRKIPIKASARIIAGEKASLSITCAGATVHAEGDEVSVAKNAPVTDELLYRNLSKLGGMPYSLNPDDFTCENDGCSFITTSQINSLRRSAVSLLERAVAESTSRSMPEVAPAEKKKTKERQRELVTAFFPESKNIPACAADSFDVIFLPYKNLKSVKSTGRAQFGISMPLWLTDADIPHLKSILERFKEGGGRYTLAHTYSQIVLSRKAGLIPIASERLNVTNKRAAEEITRMGAEYVILSPELKTGAIRELSAMDTADCGCIVYGNLATMLLRRCIMADSGCSGKCGGDGCLLPRAVSDRKGTRLNLLPTWNRMNIILNPHPIWSADKNDFGSPRIRQFFFTTESPDEVASVIRAYEKKLSPEEAGMTNIKRM